MGSPQGTALSRSNPTRINAVLPLLLSWRGRRAPGQGSPTCSLPPEEREPSQEEPGHPSFPEPADMKLYRNMCDHRLLCMFWVNGEDPEKVGGFSARAETVRGRLSRGRHSGSIYSVLCVQRVIAHLSTGQIVVG